MDDANQGSMCSVVAIKETICTWVLENFNSLN